VSALREQFLAALEKLQPQAVDIPGMDSPLYVRPLTVVGMANVHAIRENQPSRIAVVMLIDSVVDEKGDQLFTDSDEPAVSKIPGHIADKLLEKIQEISRNADTGTKEATGN
jgi:hypothetical protein